MRLSLCVWAGLLLLPRMAWAQDADRVDVLYHWAPHDGRRLQQGLQVPESPGRGGALYGPGIYMSTDLVRWREFVVKVHGSAVLVAARVKPGARVVWLEGSSDAQLLSALGRQTGFIFPDSGYASFPEALDAFCRARGIQVLAINDSTVIVRDPSIIEAFLTKAEVEAHLRTRLSELPTVDLSRVVDASTFGPAQVIRQGPPGSGLTDLTLQLVERDVVERGLAELRKPGTVVVQPPRPGGRRTSGRIIVYHWTEAASATEILRKGFDLPVANTRTNWYGPGIYAARDPFRWEETFRGFYGTKARVLEIRLVPGARVADFARVTDVEELLRWATEQEPRLLSRLPARARNDLTIAARTLMAAEAPYWALEYGALSCPDGELRTALNRDLAWMVDRYAKSRGLAAVEVVPGYLVIKDLRAVAQVVEPVGQRLKAKGQATLRTEAASTGRFVAAYLAVSGATALATGDVRHAEDAALSLKDPSFWTGFGAFTGASSASGYAMRRSGFERRVPRRLQGLVRMGIPMAAGMTAMNLATGQADGGAIARSTGAYLGAGYGVHAATQRAVDAAIKPILRATPAGRIAYGTLQVGQLSATLALGDQIDRGLQALLQRP